MKQNWNELSEEEKRASNLAGFLNLVSEAANPEGLLDLLYRDHDAKEFSAEQVIKIYDIIINQSFTQGATAFVKKFPNLNSGIKKNLFKMLKESNDPTAIEAFKQACPDATLLGSFATSIKNILPKSKKSASPVKEKLGE